MTLLLNGKTYNFISIFSAEEVIMGFSHHHIRSVRREGPSLKRSLGLFEVTVAGVGIILGAGIYALIGIGAGYAGNGIWLAFLLSAFLSAFTGLSYAELSTLFKDDGGEYDYAEKAFNKKTAWVVGMLVLATGFISAAAVALGFGRYLSAMTGSGNVILFGVLLILVMTIINVLGIKQSSFFNIICTIIEFAGLFFIAAFGFKYLGNANYLDLAQGMHGVFKAAALVFFAYMGFESIVKLTEETKNPEKTIPKALVLSVIISAVLYVLVALIAVSVVPWQELAASKAPLASVAAALVGSKAFLILAIVALFSTANTVLVTLVTSSRLLYGMAQRKSLPAFLSHVHQATRTPMNAILVMTLITILFTLIGNIEFVANLNDVFLFMTFGMVNLANIVLRYTLDRKRSFRAPVNVGKFSVLSLLGLLTSIFMLVYAFGNIL